MPYEEGFCGVPVSSPVPGCTVSLSAASFTLTPQVATPISATITDLVGTVTQVNFSSSDTNVATVTSPDTDAGYSTDAVGQSSGTAVITAGVVIEGAERCTDTETVNVAGSTAWWQVQGGNVHANVGDVVSSIPLSCSGECLPYLITEDLAGETGLVSYARNVNVGEGNISEDGNNWQAKTVFNGLETDYNYFLRLVMADPDQDKIWDGSLPESSGVYFSESGQTISGDDWVIGDGEQVVLMAAGNVTIGANITVAEGGFLAIIASGDIEISEAVTHVEGVFISDGVINTGGGANQLVGEGIFTGWSGFSLGRELADNTDPAEQFIYRPDLQVNAYRYLMRQDVRWQEVNP